MAQAATCAEIPIPETEHTAVCPGPVTLPADMHHPNTHLSASTSTSAPIESLLCTLRFFHKKDWQYRHGNWQRHHNSSGASGPAVTETRGKDSS